MKIAYIGIDLFLPALSELLKLNCEVMKVFTCKTDNITEFNTGIIALAEKLNIQYTLSRISEQDIINLEQDGCEAIICAGYYYKIPIYGNLPMINIHPSMLPFGRGPWPMPVEILEKRKSSGVTIHKISEGFDEGDIILQKSFFLDEHENLESFMKKVYMLLPKMLRLLISEFDSLYKNAIKQGEGEYIPMPPPEMYTIYHDTKIADADRILRAFYGYECIYEDKHGNKKLLLRAVVVNVKFIDFSNNEYEYLPIDGGYIKCIQVI